MTGLGRVLMAGIAALFLGLSGPAHASSWLEQGIYLSGPRYDGDIPGCDAGLPWVSSRFADKEGQFWNSDLRIVDYDRVRETAFRPWAADTIPRRFCSAQALVSDGRWHTVYYSIGEDTGLMGATWGVNFCVVGLDRNWAYNPRCKMARP
jgi:hypothetical protein